MTLGETTEKNLEMNNIVKINLKKLKFIFLSVSVAFTSIVLIILIFAANSKQFPDFKLLIYIGIGSLLILPLLISIIAISSWFINYRQQRVFFDLIIDTHLIPIGFTSHIVDAKSNWNFAEEVYELDINDGKIICSQSLYNKSEVEFNFFKSEMSSNTSFQKSLHFKKLEIRNMTYENLKSILYKNTFS